MRKPPIISIHIPKTAGTSLTRSFSDGFGAEHVMLDYMGDVYTANRHVSKSGQIMSLRKAFRKTLKILGMEDIVRRAISKRRGKSKSEVSPDINLIHGHFKASKYLDKYPNSPFVVVMREPLERVWSNYQHWNRLSEKDIINSWFKKGMDFEEYALHPKVQNLQSNLMAPLKIEDFSVAGTTSDLKGFLNRFSAFATDYFEKPINLTVFQENLGKKRLPEFSNEFISEFQNFHAEDYSCYRSLL